MSQRLLRIGILLLLLLQPGGAGQAVRAAPDALSGSEIIAEVNALRRSMGLAEYKVDSGLMAYAQQHSDYQASIDQSTHKHSDGSVAWQNGIQENVAAGSPNFLTASVIVYQIWSDAVHMKTMTGYATGKVGVGVASGSRDVFVTLNVRPGSAVSQPPAPGTSSPGKPPATPIPIVPLTTATPLPDGKLVHVVGYGQSLWSIAIAYGIKIDDIRRLNNLPAGATTILPGQKLLIRMGSSPTPTAEATQAAATPTPSATATPRATSTKAPSKTAQSSPIIIAQSLPVESTPPLINKKAIAQPGEAISRPETPAQLTPTPQPSLSINFDQFSPWLIALVLACAAGLLGVLAVGFRR